MKELEDTHCEVKKIVELQYHNWDLSSSIDDDENLVAGSPRSNGSSLHISGGFIEDTNYSWTSSGNKLFVFNTKTGVRTSSWTFKERVSCVSPFPNQPGQLPLLLVGTDNNATRIKDSVGMVCIFDCTISQVLRAIKMPAGVEQLCVINGGAKWEDTNEKKLNNALLENSSGIACVTLKNLNHLMIDLRRNSWDNPLRFPCADESNPAEAEILDSANVSRHRINREKHSVYNLMNERLERYIGFNREEFESSALYQESLTTVIICSRKIGCLISGCLGRVIIWQSDGVVRWISPAVEDSLSVSHLALLEPTDDPRPFYYLWIAYQEEASLYPPVLKMYALLFEKKCSDKGINIYFNLEGEPSLKFELELEEKNRIISLDPIIRENNPEQTESGNKRGEDSLLLINIDSKTILFDLNQWYKEQMPRFIRECQNNQAILSTYSTKSEISASENTIINSSYISSTLKEFSCTNPTPPEEFFYPNSLSFEWIQLGTKKLIIWMTRGVQAHLLREIMMAGPIIMIQPTKVYHRCVTAGLISHSSDLPYNNDVDSQRDGILTLCLEQRWTLFLLKCANEWSDGSAAYLYPALLRWGIQQASTIKLSTHELCIPLFDQSGNSIGEAEVKNLRFFSQQMECLCNVVDNLPIETNDLEQQRRALHRISMYLEILLWFYDVGLLPETQDIDEETLPISFILRIPYPVDKLVSIYKEKREQYSKNVRIKKDNEEDLFIDELITRECPALKLQWEQESNEVGCGGQYPPPSLQSLLRSCLTDCYNPNSNEMENKHQIIIYLLMDLVMLLQGSCPNVDQLIKYPSAFKFSPGLIKLTQALFLLDHEDYQGFLDIMTGQLVFESDIKDWHHKLVMRTLIRSSQSKLALIYLTVRKPPLSSIDDQSIAVILSVERGLVQSAFHRRPPSHYTELLMRFFRACKVYGKLNDILHLALNNEEEEAFIKFLEQEKCEETRLLYYLQRSRHTEASNIFSADQNLKNLSKSNKSASLSIFQAYNATLPEITRRLTFSSVHRNMEMDSRHPRPMSHQKSRIKTREIYETVIRKAKETYHNRLLPDRSRIPFLSAPCSSWQPAIEDADTNCVLFVERSQKLRKKRSLNDISEDMLRDEHLNLRKRRKISDLSEKANKSITEIGNHTPLVRKKSHILSLKEPSCETPQSILKIRQLIRGSASPLGKISSSQEENIIDKKPRQIRFSINQSRSETSTVEEMEIDENYEEETNKRSNDKINEEDSEEEGIKQLEVSDIQEVAKNSSVSPQRDVSAESDAYFSPNESTKSINATAVLTDSTTYYSKSMSGPRPRPCLRKSQLSSSQVDINKKLSTDHSSIDSISDSIECTVDGFLKSNIVSSTFIDGFTPKTRARLSSFSQCASAVLSDNTSVESTQPINSLEIENRGSKSPSTSFNTSQKNNITDSSDKNQSTITKYSSIKTSVVKKKIFEEDVCDENDKTEDVEIVDEIEKETKVESAVKEEFESIAVQEIIEERNNANSPDDNSSDIQLISQEIEEDPLTLEIVSEVNEEVLVVEGINNVVEDNKEIFRAVDDYEDELMALKYDDEEENDVYESLHNSVEVEIHQSIKTVDKTLHFEKSPKKTVAGKFYEEFNITDDESSTSILSHTMEKMSSEKMQVIHNVSQATTIALSDSINITDDETDDSRDTSQHCRKLKANENANEDVGMKNFVFGEKSKDQESHDEVKEVPQTYDECKDEESQNKVEELSSSHEDDENITDELPQVHKENKSQRSEDEVKVLSQPLKDDDEIEDLLPSHDDDEDITDDLSQIHEESKNQEFQEEIELFQTYQVEELFQSSKENTDEICQNKVEELPQHKKNKNEVTKLPQSPAAKLEEQNIILKSDQVEEEIVISEELTPIRMTRSRRASSVAPISQESSTETPETRSLRTRRANSLAKDIFSPAKITSTLSSGSDNSADTPVKKGRGRRSTSLIKEVLTTSILPEQVLDEINEVPVRRRGRRAASVQKEIIEPVVKIISKNIELSENSPVAEEKSDKETDTPQKKRGRRAASVNKDVDKSDIVPKKTRGLSVAKEIDNSDKNNESKRVRAVSTSSEIAQEIAVENSHPPKRLRAGSVSKESTNESVVQETKPKRTRTASSIKEDSKEAIEENLNKVPRRARAASVSKDNIEEISRKTKTGSIVQDNIEETSKRTRAGSVVKDTIEETSRKTKIGSVAKGNVEETSRKTRAGSVAKDNIEETSRKTRAGSVAKDNVEETSKRTRAGSVAKDNVEEISRKTRAGSVAKDNVEETSKRTRVGSVAKDNVEEISRKTRAGSVAKDNIEETSRKTKTGSVSKDNIEETSRRTRKGSVSKDNTEKVPRKTRGGSVTKDDEEISPRVKRAASASKELIEDSMTVRKVRASSATKDYIEDVESKIKRVTRRKVSNKDIVEENVTKNSIINDVIPEEDSDDDDNEAIFDKKVTQKGSINNDESIHNILITRKTRATSITAIPEEDENTNDRLQKKNVSKGRLRRAMSVDLPETKRRTRGLARSAISEEHNEEEESHQMQTDTEMKSKKIPTRRKRAASETKDINNTLISLRPKRTTKGSQKKSDTDQQSLVAEADKSEMDEDEVFSLSTVTGSSTRSTQSRRPIVNFITSLNEEGEKAAIKIKKTNKSRQIRQTLFIPGIRTKFEIRYQINHK